MTPRPSAMIRMATSPRACMVRYSGRRSSWAATTRQFCFLPALFCRAAGRGCDHGADMKFGIAIFPTDYAIAMTELGPAVEEHGFESLWVAEHTHIPVSHPPLGPTGAELPKQYWHTLDPFLALTAAALNTSTLLVATGICLLI